LAQQGVGDTASTVTELLQLIADGSKDAEADLFPIVYGELRQIARRLMRREAGNHTLQTTALVHEAYLRLARPELPSFKNRTHFFAVAATVMRRVLVDYARAKRAAKRLRADQIGFDETGLAVNLDKPELVLIVDTALTRLSQLDQRQGRIVELRFFAGMTVEETAEVLHVSTRTVKREWQLARAWLYGELQSTESSAHDSTQE
jgi:RNA polymerase sigma-70 factor (ECF subfamily)